MVLAEAFAKSKLFGCETKEQALSLMALCEAQGLHPANAVQEYHIIQGRPSLKADAMLTRFQRSGGRVNFTTYTDEKVEATFEHPQGGTLTVAWDMTRAKKAELGGKGMWLKYPRQMLRSRVISEGVRSLFPGVLGGMYTPEEVVDFDNRTPAEKWGPAPADLKKMDTEFLEQTATPIIQHIDMAKSSADEDAQKAWDLYKILDDDEKVQVFGRFNTKQKDRWRKIEAAMSHPPKVNGEAQTEAVQ
jgi:hypothetical protein